MIVFFTSEGNQVDSKSLSKTGHMLGIYLVGVTKDPQLYFTVF